MTKTTVATVQRRLGWTLRKEHMETVKDKVSVTVPNEAVTVRQLFERMGQGVSTDRVKQPTGYVDEPDHDDPDLEKLKDYDLADLQEHRERLADTMVQKEDQLKQITATIKEKQQKLQDEAKEIQAIVQEYRARKSSGKPAEGLSPVGEQEE